MKATLKKIRPHWTSSAAEGNDELKNQKYVMQLQFKTPKYLLYSPLQWWVLSLNVEWMYVTFV